MRNLLFIICGTLLGLAARAEGVAPSPEALSLEFIQNKGQWPERVRYAAPLPGGQRLFAETTGFTLALLADGGPALHGHGAGPKAAQAPQGPVRGHAVALRFAGAAPVTPTAHGPTPEHRNYLTGNDPAHWAQDVRSYRTLRYANLWPGVSARLYESADQHLEYDFEVAAGASTAAIAVRHEGATGLTLDAAGNLLVRTSVGTVREQAPRAWQLNARGQRQPVACRYVLAGAELRFALGPYDRRRPLTIDPVVVFATYSGSTADNWGFTATYDDAGNLYSGGIAFGVGFPASPGAFQTSFAGLVDMALIKYNISASGPTARAWATYLGGSSCEFPHSLVVNNRGELLVLGSTGSSNYPTTAGALQRAFAGGTPASPFGFDSSPYNSPNGSDLVISRLAANGGALVGSTYLGGSDNDGLLPLDPAVSANSAAPQLAHNYGDPFRGDILVDAADNVYIASHTESDDFPVARGFANTYRGGSSDGVVCKLSPGLTALTWGSFLGGSGADGAYSLQLDPASGDVYVAGGTLSPNFPTTAGAYRTARPGNVDGFAARIAASGTSLLRATYVGTTAYDQAYFLQLGTDGGVYLLGQTRGAFPVTPGLYNTANGTQFLQKLDANLGSSLLATVFGTTTGNPQRLVSLSPTAFLVDRCDRVYVCGWGGQNNQDQQPYLAGNGNTTGLPTTPGAAQTTTDGNDFYLAQFAAGLTGIAYGTFYGYGNPNTGGEHVDGGTSRFDPRGIVYQAVCSCFSATGFPVPPGANTYSTTNGTGNSCNNAAFVLNFEPSIANAGSDQTVCATAGPQLLVGTPAGGVWSGPGVTGSAATGFFFTPSLALSGVQTLTYTVLSTGLCTTSDVRRMTVSATPTATFTPLLQTLYCRPAAGAPPLPVVPLTATPGGGVFSGPGVSGSPATGFVFAPGTVSPGTVQLTYTLSAGGCLTQASQQVTVGTVTAAAIGADTVVCGGGPAITLRGRPAGGTFAGPGVSGNAAAGYVFRPATVSPGVYTISYNALSLVGCPAVGTRRITVVNAPAVSFGPFPQSTFCLPTSQVVPLTGSPAGGTFSGPGIRGSAATGFTFSPNEAGLVQDTVELKYTYSSNGCTAQATRTVTLFQQPAVSIRPDTALCDDRRQPIALRGSPAGGTFTGLGVSGSVATGFFFTAPVGFAGSVTVTYAIRNGFCTGSATRRISVAPLPATQPAWQPVACPETRLAPLAVRFTPGNSNLAGASVTWDFGDGRQSTELSPVHTYASPGTFRPTFRLRYNQDRCETLAALPAVEVKERKVPNVITPNGDGQNETFKLGPDCTPRLQVFSRWGRQVYEAAAYNDEWNAAGQPAGIYYYFLTYPDGHRTKGWVEVIR